MSIFYYNWKTGKIRAYVNPLTMEDNQMLICVLIEKKIMEDSRNKERHTIMYIEVDRIEKKRSEYKFLVKD